MSTFYESRIGFIAEVLVYGISVLVYLLIRKMTEVNEARYKSTLKRVKWEEWSLKKIPGLKFIVNRLTPGPYSKKRFNLMKLLKDSNSPLEIEWLTLHRLILTLFVFFLLVSGLFYAHEREKKSALFSIGPNSLFVGDVSEDEYIIYKEATEFDRRIIEEIKSIDGLTPEKFKQYVAEQLGIDNISDPKVKQAYERVVNKWLIVENAYLKWYEVLFAIIVGIFVWHIPVLLLQFQKYLRYKDMENEVHQYLVLISILREFDRMSVYTILTWLERIGVVFKDPIQKTIQIYDSGPEESLQTLSDEVNFEPFNQIVERLELSIARISIKEAFEDIDMEIEFYLEQRAEGNRRTIESKSEWAKMICWIPILTLTIFYLIGPLIYLSIIESRDLISHLAG